MPLDRLFIHLATLFFLGGFALAFLSLRTGAYRPNHWTLAVMGGGFLCQCAFLYLRGQVVRQCPVTNTFELLVFVAWSMVLLYFLIGTVYRWSLLGMFTAPLVFLLQIMAVMAPDPPLAEIKEIHFWNELHKSVSLLSYGAFALSCVAGVMFLVQDRQLKKHRLKTLFYLLPPINYLHKVNRRLNLFGFILLTFGIISAYLMHGDLEGHSLLPVYLIWIVYAGIVFHDFMKGMSPRRAALASVAAFSMPLITLWIFTH